MGNQGENQHILVAIEGGVYNIVKAMRHYAKENTTAISVEALWSFRAALKSALVDERTRKDWVSDPRPEFPLTFEVADVASGVLVISDFHTMLVATVLFDAARGIRFGICAREDCKRPFAFKSRREKKFCQWYCAHITTVRKNRPRKGRQDADGREAGITVRKEKNVAVKREHA